MTERMDYRPNEPIDLGEVLGLRLDGWDQFEARAVLQLSPRPGLELRATTRKFADCEVGGTVQVKWPPENEADFLVTSRSALFSRGGPSSELVLAPAWQPLRVSGGSESPAVEVDFLVLNFPDFFGGQDEWRDHESGHSRHGRAQIEAPPWSVELRECFGFRDSVKELRATRGFVVTHRGRIVRMDQAPIEADEADLFLRALEDFLSLARGAACSVANVVAKSTGGETAWELWGCRRVDPWISPDGWFDQHHGSQLSDAFPGFWRLYGSCADRRRALHEAIYWYVRSRTEQSGVDGGLVLMQAALERLVHTFVGPRPDNRTRRWLRCALSSQGIPVDFPDECGPLKEYVGSLSNGAEQADAVLALVSLRNNAVHPRKDAHVPEGAYFHAWNLARWFIELLILRVTGYSGSYGNRLRPRSVGEVENVPWVAATQPRSEPEP